MHKRLTKNFIIESKDAIVDLTYKKTKIKELDIVTGQGRKTHSYLTRLEENDLKKTRSSGRAHLIHFMDSIYMRDLSNALGTSFISIHDCGFIDFLSISKFILKANQMMKKEVFERPLIENKIKDEEVFSIFILL